MHKSAPAAVTKHHRPGPAGMDFLPLRRLGSPRSRSWVTEVTVKASWLGDAVSPHGRQSSGVCSSSAKDTTVIREALPCRSHIALITSQDPSTHHHLGGEGFYTGNLGKTHTFSTRRCPKQHHSHNRSTGEQGPKTQSLQLPGDLGSHPDTGSHGPRADP